MSSRQRFKAITVWGILIGIRAAGQTCPGSEPASDFCDAARMIPGTPGLHEVIMDVSSATGSETLCGVTTGHTVWFELIPAADGTLHFSTCHPATTYDTVVTAYQGGDSMCDFMAEVGCVDDTATANCDNGCSGSGSEIAVTATAGTRYRFVVGAYNSNSAGCNLCLGVQVYLDTQFDTVEIDSPIENAVVGGLVCLSGTVWDELSFSHYEAQYRPAGGGTFQPVDAGSPIYSTPVLNGLLATWDTSGVPDGNYALRVIGADASGHSLTSTLHTVVVDNTPPVAALTAPVACSTRAGLVEVTGTAADTNLLFWGLQYTGGGMNSWMTIASGISDVVNDTLATWDTSGLPDCAYTLRLLVTDATMLNCNQALHQESEIMVSLKLAADTLAEDTDGDGMPDLWESNYMLDPDDPADAGEDPDGDHHTNLEEYQAGTHPRDPASSLRITESVVEEQDVRVTWTVSDSRHYLLQGGNDLPGGIGNNLNPLISIPPGSGAVTDAVHRGGASLSNFFYRVRLMP